MAEPVRVEVRAILMNGDGVPSNRDPDGFVPPDPHHFGVDVQILIGSPGEVGTDSFDVTVCTPAWAAEALAEDWNPERWPSGYRSIPDAVIPGAAFWFMRRWDRDEFEAAVAAVVAACSPGPDFGTVASRIGRLIPWEFAYRFDAEANGTARSLPSAE
jgi:hypothetical protein